jgi:hypothetical protein
MGHCVCVAVFDDEPGGYRQRRVVVLVSTSCRDHDGLCVDILCRSHRRPLGSLTDLGYSKRARMTGSQKILLVLIESGVIYCLFQVCYFDTSVVGGS